MATIKYTKDNQYSLYGMIDYLFKDERVIFAQGLGINPHYVYEEMIFAKEAWNKSDRRQFKQIIISFSSYESSTIFDELLYKIGCEICQYYADSYQILLVAHNDTEHKHFHIIINSVNVHVGTKFRSSRSDMYHFKLYVSKVLMDHGLKPVTMK